MIVSTSNAAISLSAGPHVWDRLWRHAPDERKDAARIERERRGRRWAATREFLVRAFGRIEGLETVELGSGLGDVSVLLAEQGACVTLVDFCDRALDEAKSRFTRLGLAAHYVKANLLEDLGELAGRFDFALSVGVIEHFRGADRARVLDAHARVLRDGGAVMLTVPHAHCPTYRLWKAYLQLRGWWPYGLELPYARTELTRRARAAGLADIQCETYGFRASLTDHVLRQLLRRRVEMDDRASVWDRWFGSVLMMTARKPGRWRGSEESPSPSSPPSPSSSPSQWATFSD